MPSMVNLSSNHLSVDMVLLWVIPYVVFFLSSLPGAAVTSIQIDGVLHEFSTIEGVVEDVTSIILNVKKLALKIYSDEEKVIEIDVKGEGTVTAADITHDSDVEILNPDLHIATLGKNGHLRMRITATSWTWLYSC